MTQKGPPRDSGPGLVEVFTGDGKGKTSAAMGIALRALAHGFKVYIIYFMKSGLPSESKLLSHLGADINIFGNPGFVDPAGIKPEDREQARHALAKAHEIITSRQYPLVILDEINVAAAWKLIDIEDVLELIKNRPPGIELVLTGRYADRRLIEIADLVTEMRPIKHPYDKGIPARKGFDL